jgi:Raf kinase inhibitor-like YbhB/YbcL family protein
MPTRRTVLGAAAVALAGCSGEERTTATPTPGDNPAVGDVQQRGDLRLMSEAFENSGPIPDRYSRDGENLNPPLSVANVPDGAATLALVVDDPDAVAVAGEVFLHWLVWNIPASTTDIPADWTPGEAVVGPNDFGNRRYDGPAPPDGEHTYRFKCFALDRALELPGMANKRDVGTAMDGHVLAQTQLTGTYAP